MSVSFGAGTAPTSSEGETTVPVRQLTKEQRAERMKMAATAAGQFGAEALLVVLRSATQAREQSEQILRRNAIQNLVDQRDWVPDTIEKHINKLLGSCDICFRASDCTDSRVTRWNHLLIEAQRSKQTDSLQLTYLDMDDLFGDILMDQSLALQYGVRSGMEGEATSVRQSFHDAFKMRTALVDVVVRNRLMCKSGITGGEVEYPHTVSDAIGVLRENLKHEASTLPDNVRTKFTGLLLKCYTLMQKAKSELASLTSAIDFHVGTRVQSKKLYLCYEFLGPDLVVRIAEHSGWRCCAALIKVSRDFSQDAQLKRMLPHLSIRRVTGLFPHAVETIPEVGRCNVVCKNTLVHVIVDICVTGARRSGCVFTTAKHKDELAGFMADQFGERRHERRERGIDSAQRSFRNFDEESVSEDRFRARVNAREFFKSEMECVVLLVYADNHEEVSSNGGCPVLSLPHSMERYKTRLSTYTAKDGVPYPAYSAYNVIHLSTQDSRRLYKFKVVGKAPLRTGGQPTHKTLEAFSEPFAVVSTKRILKRRRTKEVGSR
jgi:hypothetical protein